MPEAPKQQSPSIEEPTVIRIDPINLPIRDGLPILWVDTMNLTVRKDPSVCTLRFFAALMEEKVEVARIQTSVDHLSRMADVICRAIGYYPTPKAEDERAS